MTDPTPTKPPFSRENPERKLKQAKKERERNPWDRPENWPVAGDSKPDVLYAAVGRALSAWEIYEGGLATLFAVLVTSKNGQIARRAFCAVRTHEGRIAMLIAAGEAYFHQFPNKEQNATLNNIAGRSKNWSARRNDIAHGCLAPYHNQTDGVVLSQRNFTFIWVPSYANGKDRDFWEVARYALVSTDITGYENGFMLLCNPVSHLTLQLLK